jgi:putative transposase
MLRAYKYRLYPNVNQARELATMLETHRSLYNACLESRKTVYETEKRSVKYTEQSAWFKEQRGENPWYARLNFSSAQATMRRLDKAFQAFFRRVKVGEEPGYPRFKGKDRFDSFTFPSHGDGSRFDAQAQSLRVQHVGVVKVRMHRLPVGEIKTLTVKREAEHWHVVLACEQPDIAIAPKSAEEVGIDVGLEYFASFSDGTPPIPNPRFLKESLPELRRKQRALCRKHKGSNGRKRAKRGVSKLHAKIANQRREFHYLAANDIVARYGYIAAESLNVRGMVRNRRLSRAISDAGWSAFLTRFRHKAEEAGAVVVEINPRNTSQNCSACGEYVPKALHVRVHRCPYCGVILHRDENAARNILALGRMAPGWPNPPVAVDATTSRLL